MISTGQSVTKLADFVNGSPFKPDDLGDSGEMVVRIKQLLDPTAEPDRAEPPSRPVWLESGTLVMAWSGTLAVRIWDRGPALLNQHLFRVDPKPGVDKAWLAYVLAEGVERLKPLMHGSAMTHITRTMLNRLSIQAPPLKEQRRIADHLDVETARIDALIAEQLSTRTLVERRSWSLFVELVGRVDAAKVPLRRVLRRLSDGPFGSAFTSGDYADQGAAVVRLGNIGFAQYRPRDQAYIPLELFQSFRRHEVHQGDLLIAGLGDARNHAGRCCVAPDLGPAIVKGKCFVATVDDRLASPSYLALFLSSAMGRDAIGEAARGSTRTMINLEIAKASLVALPSVADQRAIEREVEEAKSLASDLRNEINRQITLLHEHRQALITHAVTQGIDGLPGAA